MGGFIYHYITVALSKESRRSLTRLDKIYLREGNIKNKQIMGVTVDWVPLPAAVRQRSKRKNCFREKKIIKLMSS